MKPKNLLTLFVALLFCFTFPSAIEGQRKKQPSTQKRSQPKKTDNTPTAVDDLKKGQDDKQKIPEKDLPPLVEPIKIKEELKQAVKEAGDRIDKAPLGKGAISSADRRLVIAASNALPAEDMNVVATSQAFAKIVKREHLNTMITVCNRVISQFNEKVEYASYADSDIDAMRLFQSVVRAVDALWKLEEPKYKQKLDPQLLTLTKTAAEKVLLEFNTKGPNAVFNSDDLEVIKLFAFLIRDIK
jgi:hypothetical protein